MTYRGGVGYGVLPGWVAVDTEVRLLPGMDRDALTRRLHRPAGARGGSDRRRARRGVRRSRRTTGCPRAAVPAGPRSPSPRAAPARASSAASRRLPCSPARPTPPGSRSAGLPTCRRSAPGCSAAPTAPTSGSRSPPCAARWTSTPRSPRTYCGTGPRGGRPGARTERWRARRAGVAVRRRARVASGRTAPGLDRAPGRRGRAAARGVTTPGFYAAANLGSSSSRPASSASPRSGRRSSLLVAGIDLSIGAVIGLTTVVVAVDSGGARTPGSVGDPARAARRARRRRRVTRCWSLAQRAAVRRHVRDLRRSSRARSPRGRGRAVRADPGRRSRPFGAGRVVGVPVPRWVFVAVVAGGRRRPRRHDVRAAALRDRGQRARDSARPGSATAWSSSAYVVSALRGRARRARSTRLHRLRRRAARRATQPQLRRRRGDRRHRRSRGARADRPDRAGVRSARRAAHLAAPAGCRRRGAARWSRAQ